MEGADPQLGDGLTPLMVLLAMGEGAVGPGAVGPGAVGPGVVEGLGIVVVNLIMMQTLGIPSLPFNQAVHQEFILIGMSCGEE